jgi:hypothetical protein
VLYICISLTFSRIILYTNTIDNSIIDYLYIYLSSIEQAILLYRYNKPNKNKLLDSKLLLYSNKIILLLEFIINLNMQKLGLLDRGNYLLVKIN